MELRKGVELAQRYVIHEIIGSGGYAAVWKASDKQLNRDVAMKRLFQSAAVSTGEEAGALLDEARKSARLIHTNIVQIYDIVSVENEPLLVMEYVDGPSLWDVLRDKARKNETLALDKAVALLRDVLLGISFAHAKGICHRDVTPMNVLLTSSSVPKIADFGIAKNMDIKKGTAAKADQQSHGGTGNPNYMSPEQARGEPADYLSDLFNVT